ncbi:hypothetical protein OH77DRAFT_969289 [Trametes cingulata]|nr:hypothetical protein OH77DRAFT_969289 [Trametes cingulata]
MHDRSGFPHRCSLHCRHHHTAVRRCATCNSRCDTSLHPSTLRAFIRQRRSKPRPCNTQSGSLPIVPVPLCLLHRFRGYPRGLGAGRPSAADPRCTRGSNSPQLGPCQRALSTIVKHCLWAHLHLHGLVSDGPTSLKGLINPSPGADWLSFPVNVDIDHLAVAHASGGRL